MQITEILVTNLFGIFEHKISLNVDEHITIIHGPNGFGKTILLKMLNGLFNNDYSELRSIPFKKFQVNFEDGSRVWVEKTSTAKQQNFLDDWNTNTNGNKDSSEITINLSGINVAEIQSFSLLVKGISVPLSMLKDLLPIQRIGSDEWLSLSDDEVMTTDEVLLRFSHRLPARFLNVPEWWLEFQNHVRIHLIETQRLLRSISTRRNRAKLMPVVEIYAEELADVIKAKLAEYAILSQSLDRTFPARLVELMGNSNFTQEELRDKLSKLEAKRSGLKEVGLLNKEKDRAFLPAKEMVGNTKDVLAVYVQDIENKLSVFDDIAAKIDLFKTIINKRFLYNRMIISQKDGFTFTLNDESLPTTALSSGEQHELVLLYELLFKVHPDSLILIDEPELSLHVAWQKDFLRDLKEVTKLSSFDVLIATHSPQIIHDRWDLTVELKGPDLYLATAVATKPSPYTGVPVHGGLSTNLDAIALEPDIL